MAWDQDCRPCLIFGLARLWLKGGPSIKANWVLLIYRTVALIRSQALDFFRKHHDHFFVYMPKSFVEYGSVVASPMIW